MNNRFYSPLSIGIGIGIISTVFYIILLGVGNFEHPVFSGLLTMFLALLLYSFLSIVWLPSLLESRETTATSAGITFHVVSSFSIVFLLTGSLPGLKHLIIPYLSTLGFSLLLMGLMMVNGFILTKVDFSKLQTTIVKKIPLKN